MSNEGEFIFQFDEKQIIMSAYSAKKFLIEMRQQIMNYESENGKIIIKGKKKAYTQSLVENLFYRKKVSKKLFVANTKKKK